jgi:aerobic-type carbon monoxide dehydrogenase small subunit (CoxS/CutS family)
MILEVNGRRHELDVPPARRLLSVLRDDLELTGAKLGCGEGACGACAVLIDGVAVNSCLMLAAAAEGHAITTIEGISEPELSPLQRAFVQEDAVQCGFCTPGQIVSATAMLQADPSPDRDTIRSCMAGNLCRCGTYPKIERAIRRAIAEQA